jgi:predicted ester cyclase
MTATFADPLTDTSAWTAQGRSLTCECDELIDTLRIECTNPAAWLGIPVCGHDSFFCEQHRSDPDEFICGVCGKLARLNNYRWVKI